MDRREAVEIILAAGAGAVLPFPRTLVRKPIRFEVYGAGPNLMLGYPIPAKQSGPAADQYRALTSGYIDRLVDRYRVIVVDYPRSDRDVPAASFTADAVCADYLSVADAAGADRFAYFGFSWGGVVGLQLAARTRRLTALVCGGWPPLGAPYSVMLSVVRAAAAEGGPQADFGRRLISFYGSVEQSPERDAVSRLTGPRMTFAGTDDVVTLYGQSVPIGPLVAEHRAELETWGWTVRLVDGAHHDLIGKPELVVPLIRAFLDPQLLGS